MTTIVIHDLPRRGQIFCIEGQEYEVVYVDIDTGIDDGLIGLRRLQESRTEPMMLDDFLAKQPERIH